MPKIKHICTSLDLKHVSIFSISIFSMGFGTEFQGKKSHEVLQRIQEHEIRLLEVMKRCLHIRVKSDRNYADALSGLVKEAQKFTCPEFQPMLAVFQVTRICFDVNYCCLYFMTCYIHWTHEISFVRLHIFNNVRVLSCWHLM